MPNYDYKCEKCSHMFEAFQSMKEPHIKTCPKCGGTVKRLIGAGAGFIFKGSGFYATDYKKSDKTKKKGYPSEKPSDKCSGCKDSTCEFKKEKD